MLLFSATIGIVLNWVVIKLNKLTMATNLTPVTQMNTKSLKYILFWTNEFSFKEKIYPRSGQEAFMHSQCQHHNCYLTDNKSIFGDNRLTEFDAILFNGRNLIFKPIKDLPHRRTPRQIYIFVWTEAFGITLEPICDPIFDGFFNWTATFRPDSDIVFSDKNEYNDQETLQSGNSMARTKLLAKDDNSLRVDFKRKKKAVACVMSNCTPKMKELEYTNKLKKALKIYDQALDVYDKCGDSKCHNNNKKECYDLIRNDYFFHLAFEDSKAKDHLRSKMINLLKNYNVPIFYDGANYSSILPLGSYIDASKYTPERLASTIVYLINNPARYSDFFRFRNHDNNEYQYPDDARAYLCTLCAALNNKATRLDETVYENFREWWDPDYEKKCKMVQGFSINPEYTSTTTTRLTTNVKTR